jgi:hypothetical protein
MPGRDRAQILVPRERHSYWRYQLKLRGVQASRSLDIGVHQRTKPASFNLPQTIRLTPFPGPIYDFNAHLPSPQLPTS